MLAAALGGVVGPVLERILIQIAGEVGESRGEVRLRVLDGLVVDGRGYLFEEEVEQHAGGEFAERLGEVGFGFAFEG